MTTVTANRINHMIGSPPVLPAASEPKKEPAWVAGKGLRVSDSRKHNAGRVLTRRPSTVPKRSFTASSHHLPLGASRN